MQRETWSQLDRRRRRWRRGCLIAAKSSRALRTERPECPPYRAQPCERRRSHSFAV